MQSTPIQNNQQQAPILSENQEVALARMIQQSQVQVSCINKATIFQDNNQHASQESAAKQKSFSGSQDVSEIFNQNQQNQRNNRSLFALFLNDQTTTDGRQNFPLDQNTQMFSLLKQLEEALSKNQLQQKNEHLLRLLNIQQEQLKQKNKNLLNLLTKDYLQNQPQILQTQFGDKMKNLSLLYSMLNNQSLRDDYKNFKQKIQDFIKQLKQKQLEKHQRSVCVIGTCGSGKTSLLLYLNKFQQIKKKKKIQYKKKGPKYFISNEQTQQTYKVRHYYDKKDNSCCQIYQHQGVSYIQLIGLSGPGNVNQQIYNCIQNSSIFMKNIQIKLILVIEQTFIGSSNGTHFAQFMNQICSFFQLNYQNIIDSIILIISKVKLQEYENDQQQFFVDDLKNICQNNKNINKNGWQLIQKLLSQKKILIFPTPNAKNMGQRLQLIKDKINNIKFVKIQHKQKINLSQKAACTINTYISLFNLQIQQCLMKIILQIKKHYELIIQQKLNLIEQITNLKKLYVKINFHQGFLCFLKQLQSGIGLDIHLQFKDQIRQILQISKFFCKLTELQNFQSRFIKIICLQLIQIIKKLQILNSHQSFQKQKQEREQIYSLEKKKKSLQISSFIQKESRNRMQQLDRMQQLNRNFQIHKNKQRQIQHFIMSQRIKKKKQIMQMLSSRYNPIIYHHHHSNEAGCQIM